MVPVHKSRSAFHLQARRKQNKKGCVGKTVKKQRPVNLDLTTIRFPVTAISSILHRVSGVISFVAVGILLWLLGLSLSSPEGFLQASAVMNSFFAKFIMWGILTALAWHTVGGIRHMLMDFGYLAETQRVGNRSAHICFGITIVLSILAGVLVW
ncbi:succinate dehydrogenase cytochrome b556 subunit [Mixta hanseatica]|uniref:Succinate dehydrogenase cytochrome b556 subunit n=1 Tax=Mixta hanseatica TaxID=2872648 RepID=A0ABY4RB97_9GAMM|nr:succinate dehydrogenase cytochrome b556 subunit [Mixta hanseatica]